MTVYAMWFLWADGDSADQWVEDWDFGLVNFGEGRRHDTPATNSPVKVRARTMAGAMTKARRLWKSRRGDEADGYSIVGPHGRQERVFYRAP